MPSPKGTGAPLAPINLVTPGRFGLNKQNDASILGPEWATEALNAVFDISGRLTARKGWLPSTTSAMTGTPVVDVIHEYIRDNGNSTILSAGGSAIWTGTSTHTNVTGTATITVGDDWQFINFNDNCYAVQQGEQPIVSVASANFVDLTAASGTAPTGNCGIGAFGRLWICDDDKQTIQYSALLDGSRWAAADGGGFIDMSSVWPNGMDEVVALAAYNGSLIVFGKNAIVFWRDEFGSELGLDPDTIFVSDTLVGTGCIARDSVQQIDSGDILFLSAAGVQSLQRLIQERSNPVMNVSMNIRDYLLDYVSGASLAEVRTVYAPKEGFYLLILPASSRVFAFDTRGRLPDGSLRVTEWSTTIKAGCRTNSNTIYLSLSDLGGRIGTYSGYNDRTSANESTSYQLVYNSGWLDLGEEAASYLKMLKTINGTVLSGVSGNSMSVVWAFDFESDFESYVVVFDDTAGGSGEWGIGEWGIMEWGGGGTSLQRFNVPGRGYGQFLKIGIIVPISERTFALQQMNLFAKIGRLAN
jgi:hypothetical protein